MDAKTVFFRMATPLPMFRSFERIDTDPLK